MLPIPNINDCTGIVSALSMTTSNFEPNCITLPRPATLTRSKALRSVIDVSITPLKAYPILLQCASHSLNDDNILTLSIPLSFSICWHIKEGLLEFALTIQLILGLLPLSWSVAKALIDINAVDG